MTWPCRPFSSSAVRASVTHCAIVSASFRHGMTTDTRMARPGYGLMRVCLVYDCLYPYTVGGAERWYRNLAEELVARGHEVTYLTRLQWDDAPVVPGVRVLAVAPRMELYGHGRRRLLPP